MDSASVDNALTRIEAALARIEGAAERDDGEANDLWLRHEGLKLAVTRSLAQLDELIAEAASGAER